VLSAKMFRFPPPLAPGDCVAVVAPSGPFEPKDLWRGLAWIRARYRIRASSSMLVRQGYLAGSDARRAAELSGAMLDPEVKAIVCARGGYGAMRILERLPWAALRAQPKWLAGFSDITALHVRATAMGIASVHGPNVTGLGSATPLVRYRWLLALEQATGTVRWEGLRVVRPGRAEGPLVGGNLALLHAMCAAGQLQLPDGAILAIEDVTEKPYRLDRMLTALSLGGHARRLAGVVLGAFSECAAGPDGVTWQSVVEGWAGDLGIPVVAGAPFGHQEHNEAFVLGGVVRIDGDRVESP
jgi:muramoyltetrapeptide carboxypeptidase